jgi:hypothetical protein
VAARVQTLFSLVIFPGLIYCAQPIVNELRANMVRVEADFSATRCSSSAAATWQPGAVSVRLHHGGPQGAKPKGEVIAKILTDIKQRQA